MTSPISIDLIDVIDSIDLPIVVVGCDAVVTRFNPAAATLLSLTQSDVGRSLRDVRLLAGVVSDLEELCEHVIGGGAAFQREVRIAGGSRFILRVVPYTRSDRQIAGAVLTLANVTALRASIEQAIHERENAKAIINTVSHPLVVLDADLRVQTANRAFYETFQVSRQETEGVLFYALGKSQWDSPRLRPRMEEIISKNKPLEDFEVELNSPAIGPRTMVLNARCLSRAGQVAQLMLLGIEDITERKRVEKALRDSEERNRATLAQAIFGVAMTDLKGHFVEVNQAYCQITGYTEQELLATDFPSITHPGDRDDNMALVHQMLAGEIPGFVIEKRYVRKDHSHVWVRNSVSLIRDREGRPANIVALTFDLTERKRAEEASARLAAIVESSDDAIASKTLDGIITSWNRSAERMFGYTAAEAMGQHISLIIPEERRSEEDDIIARLRRGEKLEHFETERQAKGGERIHISLTVSPIRNAEGRIIGASKVARDITERKEAEQTLAALRDQLAADLGGMRRLHEISTRLIREGDLQALLGEILDAAIEITHADFGNVQLVDRLTGVLKIVAQRGFEQEFLDLFDSVHDGMAACGTAMQSGRRVIVEDVANDPIFRGTRACEVMLAAGALAVQSTPLLGRSGDLLGIFSTHYRSPCRPDERDLHRLDLLARQAADLIERHLTEQALRESEERYHSIFRTAGVSIWEEDFSAVKAALDDLKAGGVHDFRGYFAEHPEFVRQAIGMVRIVDVNDATVRMFGANDKRELLTSLHGIFMPETEQVFIEELLAIAEGRTSFESEAILRTVRGRRLDVLLTIRFPSLGEKFDSVLVSLMDVTERRKAQAELRENTQILEILDAIGKTLSAELDLQNVVQAVTDAATKLSGAAFGAFFYNLIDDRGEFYTLYTLSGAPREAFSHFPLPRNTELFGPTFRGEGIVRLDDVTRDSRYGRNPPHHGMPPGHLPVKSYLAVPVVARNGAVLGGLFLGHPEAGVFSERHERIVSGIAAQAAIAIDNARLYEAERRARSQAEDTNRAKDEFLATLSHELRTPLNAMLGWVRMLRSGTLDALTAGRALEVVERSVSQQSRLITDLLDISRIVSGKLTLEMAALDLRTVVASVLEAMRPDAEAKAVKMTPVLAAGAVPVHGDAERLRQVVANLLSNAVKFTPNGGRVTIRLERLDDRAHLSVSDTGKGISGEFLPHVFERFRQADASSTRAQAGLGLGLAIVRHIVELHHGSVHAESEGEGKGATFTVDLPIAVLGQAHGVGTINAGQIASEAIITLTGVRVLIIDDDANSRDLFTAILTQREAEVTAVETVREALAAIRQARPDVIVCDLAMPGDDGFALIRQVRSWPSDQGGAIPALAVTAYARFEDRERALAAGFQVHLPKPVEPRDMLHAVARLAGRG